MTYFDGVWFIKLVECSNGYISVRSKNCVGWEQFRFVKTTKIINWYK